MSDIYLVITEPDYEGFSVVEAHLDQGSADARVEAANAYAEKAPKFPDPQDDADYDRWEVEIASWRGAHPFGEEAASGYVQQRYRVLPIRLIPAATQEPSHD